MTPAKQVPHLPPGARGIRLAAQPTVSVVVASACAPEQLAACLESLESQCGQHRAEIVVVRGEYCAELDRFGQRYPLFRWVQAEPGADVGLLRGLGLAAAHGDIVALTEDGGVVRPDWLGQLLRDAGPGSEQVGTATSDRQRQRPAGWAAYFAALPPNAR